MKYFVISINTERNDPVDVKCGGPYYLGFDFKIKKEKGYTLKKIETKMRSLLEKENTHYISLNVFEQEYKEPKWWTFEEIDAEIKNYK